FPADEVAKPVAETASDDAASSGGAATRVDGDRAEGSAADRLGAAATALNSKLDLNGKLDRGRQALRSLTGPLSCLTSPSARPSSRADAPTETRSPLGPARNSGPTGAGSGAGSGYGGAGYVGGSAGSGGAALWSGSPSGSSYSAAGYGDSMSSSASYGGP